MKQLRQAIRFLILPIKIKNRNANPAPCMLLRLTSIDLDPELVVGEGWRCSGTVAEMPGSKHNLVVGRHFAAFFGWDMHGILRFLGLNHSWQSVSRNL